jgi:hypothetical protein
MQESCNSCGAAGLRKNKHLRAAYMPSARVHLLIVAFSEALLYRAREFLALITR